jgi:glycosyltransferase involved in cell wall biosynthesis
MPQNIDIIVPVFNEEDILPEFYKRIQSIDLSMQIIFIDNASTDRSVDIISTLPDVLLIKHQTNEGYGASLVDGIRNSRNEKIIIIDADCEYPPEAILDLVTALDEMDVVYTSRFLHQSQGDMPFFKRFGNRIISSLFNLLFRQKVTDLYTGCKAINRSALSDIHLQRKGFEHVLELGAKLARKGVTIHEIPVHFTPRHTGEAKMQHLSETIKYLYYLFYYHLTLP